MNHRWSGWPGAWCIDCGKDDPTERALAEGKFDDEGLLLPDAFSPEDIQPCTEPGSGRFDPYNRK